MSLTDAEKLLITESFAKVAPISEKAAELFYNRLWETDPSTKELFTKTDMKEQGRKLMQTLATAVGALYSLETIVPVVEQLGKRHIAYGVKKEQYDSVGAALLWTLEQGLGADFTPEVKEAWTKVYGVLAGIATSAYKDENSNANSN
jgi:hemoglobin-like flavoprotein